MAYLIYLEVFPLIWSLFYPEEMSVTVIRMCSIHGGNVTKSVDQVKFSRRGTNGAKMQSDPGKKIFYRPIFLVESKFLGTYTRFVFLFETDTQ